MDRRTARKKEKVFYHIVTLIICLTIVLTAGIIILIYYNQQVSSQTGLSNSFYEAKSDNDKYFSDKIIGLFDKSF